MTADGGRGAVVKGPALFGPHRYRPYVRLSEQSHPFSDEEALYAAVTTTERPAAVRLDEGAFRSGGLPRESYVNPWTIATVTHADIAGMEGQLTREWTDRIATETAGYMGLELTGH
jgi:hypothetical protein